MAKCKYEFSFKIECDEPVYELKIKLVDKKGRATVAATPVQQESCPAMTTNNDEDEDETVEVPPEMMMDF